MHVVRDFPSTELGDSLSGIFLKTNKSWLRDSYSFMKDVQSNYVLF